MWMALSNLVGTKIRLVIEYTLIAAVVAISGATMVLWMQNTSMETKLGKLQADLHSYKAEVMELKELRRVDATTMSSLLTDMKQIAEHDTEVRVRLTELETSNENVRIFLETSLPLELVCLLADTCARDPSFPTPRHRP